MHEEFYKLGALRALEDAGLLKASASNDTMHPIVQKGMNEWRDSGIAQKGNRYAQNWYPNVPATGGPRPTAAPAARPAPAAKPAPAARQPTDYGQLAANSANAMVARVNNSGNFRN